MRRRSLSRVNSVTLFVPVPLVLSSRTSESYDCHMTGLASICHLSADSWTVLIMPQCSLEMRMDELVSITLHAQVHCTHASHPHTATPSHSHTLTLPYPHTAIPSHCHTPKLKGIRSWSVCCCPTKHCCQLQTITPPPHSTLPVRKATSHAP